jgi:hypothetical protein
MRYVTGIIPLPAIPEKYCESTRSSGIPGTAACCHHGPGPAAVFLLGAARNPVKPVLPPFFIPQPQREIPSIFERIWPFQLPVIAAIIAGPVMYSDLFYPVNLVVLLYLLQRKKSE